MRLHSLELTNVGPFAEASINFQSDAGVTFLTGLNGSGKTVVLDALRFWFGGQYGLVDRPLLRTGAPGAFRVAPHLTLDDRDVRDVVTSPDHHHETLLTPTDASSSLWTLPHAVSQGRAVPSFVVDYWCAATPTDPYEIAALEIPQHRGVLVDALSGSFARARTTRLLCHADYLRESADPHEKSIGEALQRAIVQIIERSLLDGQYVGVRRTTLTPYVKQAGHTVPLASISSGNAYQINRMVGLLGRMYAVCILSGSDPATLCETPGLLLIDEVENHLHPRWQKRFVPCLRELFPNVQVVATTHSPFVLASVDNARTYVCRYEPAEGTCVVVDETERYGIRPIDEILLTDAFAETQPWSEEVSALLDARARAFDADDTAEIHRLNAALLRINPQRFAYLRVDEGAP